MTPEDLTQLSTDDVDLLAKSLMLRALNEILLDMGIVLLAPNPSLDAVARELERRVMKQPVLPTDELPF